MIHTLTRPYGHKLRGNGHAALRVIGQVPGGDAILMHGGGDVMARCPLPRYRRLPRWSSLAAEEICIHGRLNNPSLQFRLK